MCIRDRRYDEIISKMPMREKICGFISGKKELENWDRSDLFQFYHDTIALYGSLNFIKNLITNKDISRAVRLGAVSYTHVVFPEPFGPSRPKISPSLISRLKWSRAISSLYLLTKFSILTTVFANFISSS